MNPSPRWSNTFGNQPHKSVKNKQTACTLSPTLRSLAELLFAHADEIPQGLYLELMDHVKNWGMNRNSPKLDPLLALDHLDAFLQIENRFLDVD